MESDEKDSREVAGRMDWCLTSFLFFLFFFFIRMFCSMPFILDDRKLRCCQDAAAAAEIEGRRHISIFRLESYSNEFAERGERLAINK